MAKPKEPLNPFSISVAALGVAFLITACGYGTMTLRYAAPHSQAASESSGMTEFFDRYGLPLMAAELGLLTLATGGAMWLDQARARRATPSDAASGTQSQDPGGGKSARIQESPPPSV